MSHLYLSLIALLALPALGQSQEQKSPVMPLRVAIPLQALGIYRVESMSRVINGEIVSAPVKPFDYLVFSDGSRIGLARVEEPLERIYYPVYQSGTRIIHSAGNGQVRTVEGMLASSTEGGSLRQILLTPQKLRITRMPPNSEDIVILEARKIADEPRSIETDETP